MTRRDPEAEREAQEWIEAVTGEAFPTSFEGSLKDGVLLCQLVNRIVPGSVKRISMSHMPFQQMENVSNFLKAIRKLGMNEFEMFDTADLYEAKHISQVCLCIHAFGRLVQAKFPDFTPTLGHKVVEKNVRNFTAEQLREAQYAVGLMNMGSSSMGQTMAQNALKGDANANASIQGAKLVGASGGAAPAAAPSPAPAPAPASEMTEREKQLAAMKERMDKAKADAAKKRAQAQKASASGGSGSGSEADNWVEHTADDGSKYYVNKVTGESAWTKPVDAGGAGGGADDWEALDHDGTPYYRNRVTGETQWEPPAGMGGGASDTGLPAGWAAHQSEDGTVYFVEAATGQSSWTPPPGSTAPAGWVAAVTEDGTPYYTSSSGASSWTWPM